MFDGFTLRTIRVGDAELRVRVGGNGPAALLLHGHPQTHVMWHRVAPLLAESLSVVAPDLPGYGRSRLPDDAEVAAHSKRAMASVALDLMRGLGHERFAVVGHDRGARVAYRLALDHPSRVERLAVLDILPTGEMWRRMDRELASAYWHWLFLAQPAPLPERLLTADPEAYYFREGRDGYRDGRGRFDPAALDDYLEACRDPRTIHTMCQDYRAGASIDRELDEADAGGGHRIECPTLVLWSATAPFARFDPLAVWRAWADDVRGKALPAGHYLAEEVPELVNTELLAFLAPA